MAEATMYRVLCEFDDPKERDPIDDTQPRKYYGRDRYRGVDPTTTAALLAGGYLMEIASVADLVAPI